jgi:hypothetical protein
MTRQPGSSPSTLADHLAWLDAADCTCPHEWKGLGHLYGTSMGNGWVRLETVPSCPVHGTSGRWTLAYAAAHPKGRVPHE